MGGSARGRNLHSPEGLEFRPTTGRVKEFIFNVLQSEVGDANILDLFSGTGSLGIEALSRGARHVTFVEQAPASLRLLRENLSICGFDSRATLLPGDVFEQVQRLGSAGSFFDLILADPPFKQNYRQNIVSTVSEAGVLGEDGILLIEHEQHDPDAGGHALVQKRQRRFGSCLVTLYGVSS